MTEIETQTGEDLAVRDLQVGILTGYLYESLEKMISEAPNLGWALSQVFEFGHPPQNLSGTKHLTTPKFRVHLRNPEENGESYSQGFYPCLTDPKSTFIISGSAEQVEERIIGTKDSGILIARYSIFYGGKSNYTGRSAAESGYAFDMPKDVATARKLLTTDSVLEAIAARDEKAIVGSLEVMNRDLQYPVLITPFLHEVLNKRSGGYQR
ncbi:MAG: hypothetical protein Q8Q31_05265 [Nanoarchaeota archaeon]|nr:hypothetical protein [Nanoarchaeota archaeon]